MAAKYMRGEVKMATWICSQCGMTDISCVGTFVHNKTCHWHKDFGLDLLQYGSDILDEMWTPGLMVLYRWPLQAGVMN